MSQLRSLIAETTSFNPEDLSDDQLAAEIAEALFAQQLLETAVARWVKSLSDRGGHLALGYPNPTALLSHLGRVSGGRARQIVGQANAADRAPHAFRTWADGRLSTGQAKYLFDVAESVPDEFPDAEERLVDIVEGLSVRDTRKTLEYWRQSVDGPGELNADVAFARRGLSVSKTSGGMRRVDGWLTPTAGQAFETALGALMDPPGDEDTRTPRQRRHDALEDLSRDWLDHADTPHVGGEKPHIIALADLPALQGVAGGTHETIGGDIIDIDTLRMLACDCSVSRIVLGPDSEVLDVGRKTRVWAPAQRRAIIARDRHCQADGCDRDFRYCDIHHTDHWADGGETSVDKGKLFCRFHHTIEHLKEKLQRRRRSRIGG
ncbi:MAG TPA: DUF222 domain-containing protein [Acidimicrobiia bacterium]|nr:DUF222 domain-containing protein [Acidimicrobiia bacterium]